MPYKVIDIEGIGPTYAGKLNELGIYSTTDLLKAGATKKDRMEIAEKTGIPDLGLNILLRVSILSRMGRKTEASALLKTLKETAHHKSWVSKEFVSRLLLDKKLVDQLFQGLKSASIPVLTVA